MNKCASVNQVDVGVEEFKKFAIYFGTLDLQGSHPEARF